jgi:hypothetical protein
VLAVTTEEVDGGEGHAGHLGGELDQCLELAAGRAAQHVVRHQRPLAPLVITRSAHSPGAFQTASHRCRSGSIGSSSPSRSRTDISSSVSRDRSPVGANG